MKKVSDTLSIVVCPEISIHQVEAVNCCSDKIGVESTRILKQDRLIKKIEIVYMYQWLN